MKFIRNLSTLDLFYLVCWSIFLLGGLYIKLFEPNDSVLGIAVVPFGVLAVFTTPVVLINWAVSLYKRRRSQKSKV